MSCIELVFPPFKKDLESVTAALAITAKFGPTLQEGGAPNAVVSKIVRVDGEDLEEEDRRYVFIVEWPHSSNFYEFLHNSQKLTDFRAELAPFFTAGAAPQLHQTTSGVGGWLKPLVDGGVAVAVVNLVVAVPFDQSDEGVKAVVDAVGKGLPAGGNDITGAVCGSSLDLDQKQVVVLQGFADLAAYESAASSGDNKWLDDVKKLASVTDYVTRIDTKVA